MATIMRLFKSLGRIVVVSLSLLSIAISTVILLSGLVYRLFTNYQDLATPVGLTRAQLLVNYDTLYQYLINPLQNTLQFPDFASSAGGLQHFAEVKSLMLLNFGLSIIGLVVLIITFMKNKRQKQRFYIAQELSLAAYVPLLLLATMVVAFDKVFVLFHQIFFSNDLWLFNPLTDPIITVLPESLFMIYFMLGILIYEVLLYIYRKLLK